MQNEFSDIQAFASLQFQDGQDVLVYYDMEDINYWRDFWVLGAFVAALQLLTVVFLLLC